MNPNSRTSYICEITFKQCSKPQGNYCTVTPKLLKQNEADVTRPAFKVSGKLFVHVDSEALRNNTLAANGSNLTCPSCHVSLGPKLPTPDFVTLWMLCHYFADIESTSIYARFRVPEIVLRYYSIDTFTLAEVSISTSNRSKPCCNGKVQFYTDPESNDMQSTQDELVTSLNAQVACTSCHACPSGRYLSCKSWPNKLEMETNQSNKMQNSANRNWFSRITAGLLGPPRYW